MDARFGFQCKRDSIGWGLSNRLRGLEGIVSCEAKENIIIVWAMRDLQEIQASVIPVLH